MRKFAYKQTWTISIVLQVLNKSLIVFGERNVQGVKFRWYKRKKYLKPSQFRFLFIQINKQNAMKK